MRRSEPGGTGARPSTDTTASKSYPHNDFPNETTHDHATLEQPTLDPAHPREWHAPMVSMSMKIWRQLLGLNPFKGSYASLFRTLDGTRDRLIVCFGAICAIAAGTPLPIIGVIFGQIISSFPPDEDELQLRLSQLLGVAAAFFVVTTGNTVSFGLTGDKIAIRLREKLLFSLLHLDQAYLDTRNIDMNALLGAQIDSIQVGCSEKVGIFIQSMSYFVAAFIVGFILNAKLTGILLAAVLPTMTIIVYSGSTTISKLSKKITIHAEASNNLVESTLRSIKTIQAFDMIERMCITHIGFLEQSTKVGLRKAIVAALELGGAYFTAYSANALAFFVGSKMAVAGEDGGDSGTIYAVVFLILDASFVVGQFAPFLEIFARAASAYGTIQELLEACPSPRSGDGSAGTGEGFDMHGQEVRFEDVSFAYPARATVKAVNGLNLTLPPGKFTAAVGTSGGGKSTLVSLLLRIYDYSGNIWVGPRELRSLDFNDMRSQMAVLEQDCILFSGTICDNICHGLVGKNVSDQERESLCQQAIVDAAVDFLDVLPNGIRTQVDNTLQLSGGQRQRICLARALIKNPAILILDEPTSALDGQSEIKVMQAVKKAAARGTTVFMIAHRLSTTLDADQIAVVSDGQIVEEGAPATLSESDTIFRGLLEAQNASVGPRPSEPGFDEVAGPRDGGVVEKSDSDDDTAAPKSEEKLVEPKIRELVRSFYRLTSPEHGIIAIGLLSSVFSGCIIIGEAIVFGNLVQLLNTEVDRPDFQSEANFYCLMFFVVALVALGSYACSGASFGFASTRLTSRVQATLLRNVLHLDLAWFSGTGRSAHELTSSFSKDSGDLACLSGVALGTIFTVFTSVSGGIILAHVIAWKIAIVLLAAVPIMLASGYIRLRMLAKSETRHRSAYSDATGLAIEACRSRKTVTILGLEEFILNRYHDSLQKRHKEGYSFTFFCNTLLAFSLAITYFVYALAYWWGSKQVREGMYSQRDFFIVLPALLFSAQSAGQLFSLSPEIARARTAAASIFKTLSYQPEILADWDEPSVSNKSSAASSPERKPREKPSKLEFRNVSFSYSGHSAQTVLQDVNLLIDDGDTVAFVGPSGAGKSSTISLIERFYDPTDGSILLDGVDLRTSDVRDIRNQTSLVPQEPELFPGSITHNIRLGARNGQTVEQHHIEEVAKRCGLHNFIVSLPESYNTECGSVGGSQLSGGQRQRLSLARALVRNPQILLLDEPTSALDAHSERHVQEALREAAKGRTTITVAHRLASIQDADKIVVFDRGRILEHGTHSELMKQGELYASMARAQALT